jgi:cell division protein FtsL
VLLLVMFALAATAVYPLRQYVSQQDRIERLQAKQQALAAENARLEVERRRLQDPAYVQQLAKRDYHLVAPGEEAWVVTGTPPAGGAAPAAAAAGEDPPWYKRAWRAMTGWLG